jgi:hypothetical protein
MKTLIAAAALSLMAGAAFAGEGNGDPFPFRVAGPTTYLNNYKQAAPASQNPFPFTVPGTPMVNNAVLPSNGADGVVQTANSLPQGFMDSAPGQNGYPRPATQFAQPGSAARPTRG